MKVVYIERALQEIRSILSSLEPRNSAAASAVKDAIVRAVPFIERNLEGAPRIVQRRRTEADTALSLYHRL